MGFSSVEELDWYKLKITKDAQIHKLNVVSKKGFLKHSPLELIRTQLNKVESPRNPG